MINGQSSGLPKDFIVIFDCHTQLADKRIKEAMDMIKINNITFDAFKPDRFTFQREYVVGFFGPDIEAEIFQNRIKGTRYDHGSNFVRIHDYSYWYLSCARYSTLVFSNSGDLIYETPIDKANNGNIAYLMADKINSYFVNKDENTIISVDDIIF